MKKKDGKILENCADLAETGTEQHLCDYCDDSLIFAMKDNYHEFSIGITTILNCLSLAEKQGAVPELPTDWWISIINRYKMVKL